MVTAPEFFNPHFLEGHCCARGRTPSFAEFSHRGFFPFPSCPRVLSYYARNVPKKLGHQLASKITTQEILWHTNYLLFLIRKMRWSRISTRRQWKFITTNITPLMSPT